MEQAIKYLREAAAALPDDPTIAEHLGDAYARAGRVEEAIEVFMRVLKAHPDNKSVQEKIDKLKAQKF